MEIYEESYIRNLLKCNQCNTNFSEYDEPKSLQCGRIVCNDCESKIEKSSVNKKFKCEICSKEHLIPDEGLSINQLAYSLISSKPKQIWRGNKYENLKVNLDKLNTKSREVEFILENGADCVKTYCTEQKRLIQLVFEKKMKELNGLNESFIKKIDDFEVECIKQNKNTTKTTKTKKLIKTVDEFMNQKQSYLNRLQVDENEIEQFNMATVDLQSKLDQELKNCQYLAFNNKLIKFNSGSKQTLIGSIEYQRLNPKEILCLSSGYDCIQLMNFESGKYVKNISLDHDSSPYCLKQASYNKVIVGFNDGIIKIIDIESGTCLKTINEHSNRVNHILMISNDTFLTCSCDDSIKLFDLHTCNCIRVFYGHRDAVGQIDQISDNKIVSCSADKTIKIWDLNTGECLKTIQGHLDEIWYVKVISSKQIVTSSYDDTVKVWNIESGKCLRTIEFLRSFDDQDEEVTSIIKLTKEKVCSCAHDGNIKVWNIKTGECLMTMKHCVVRDLFKLDDNRIISGSDIGEIKIWDVNTGQCLKSFQGHDIGVYRIEILK